MQIWEAASAVRVVGEGEHRPKGARALVHAAGRRSGIICGVDNHEGLAYLHPPVASLFTVLEHPAGQLRHLGDALGADCVVVAFVGGWVQAYRTDGATNEDWFGWREPLLAPFDGTVVGGRDNPIVNEPGTMGSPPASAVTFLSTDDALQVVYAHAQEVEVEVGADVKRGEAFARIGNNGMSRNPHVHVGAWSGETPLQIRFDLDALGKLLGYKSSEGVPRT